ncbi:MAG: hypothetical protein H0U79_00955, partial [Solirubrobacterales bacterium]|nr:hypothetical protein [Solirubrobacterales bacterium]
MPAPLHGEPAWRGSGGLYADRCEPDGLDGLEALAYPSVQVLPPKTKDRRWTTLTVPTNTVIASQAWMPATSVPAGFTPGGIPVGFELVSKPYDEPTLLR